MTTIALRFPGRRYHATPWGHHVNEGLIEWPPAPWRILRALLSVGFTSLGWTEVPADARTMIEILAPVLPRYQLPPAVGAHSRHYMPTDAKPTLVFDTWAQVDDGELRITWPVPLPTEQQQILADLVVRLSYLGRSESWVEARLENADPATHNCTPEIPGQPGPGPGWEQVPLLAPVTDVEYIQWRGPQVERALANLPEPEPGRKKPTAKDKKLLADRADAASVYPADLIACLLTDTAFLRGHGWSQPPGSRRVFYWRRADAIETGAPRPASTRLSQVPVEAMLLALTTTSGNDHALPPITRALPQGELLHHALVAQGGEGSPMLRGTDDDRQPLAGHRHAHLLHLDLDGDGHLDHCLVWAPGGLDAVAQAAIRAVRRTFTKGGASPLRVAVAATGSRADLRGLSREFGTGMQAILGSADGAMVWTSITPFVPPRFMKCNGRNTVEGQLLAELEARNLPPAQVDVIDARDPKFLHLRHAVRIRNRGGNRPPVDCGFAIRLTFSCPVPGPITLGYGSHFGLGLFAAVTADQRLSRDVVS